MNSQVDRSNPDAPIIDVLKGGLAPFEVHLHPFNEVPAAPGVYCWFYPLRLSSDRIQDCLAELRKVHMFNFENKLSESGQLGWYEMYSSLQLNDGPLTSSHKDGGKWEKIWNAMQESENPDDLKNFKRVIMKATFWMPPLYIGVASDLSKRCKSHINSGGFNARFTEYAQRVELKSKEIKKLVLTTITTSTNEFDDLGKGPRELAEEILKRIGRPNYSDR